MYMPFMNVPQKYYAIRDGKDDHIVTTWAECKALTHCVKGVLYKSFPTREDAVAWLRSMEDPPAGGLRIYVDGSYISGHGPAGWAFAVIDNGVKVAHGSGVTADDAISRNIDGEITAALEAMKWLSMNNREGTIYHDYEGIARWALGQWQAKSAIAQAYVKESRPYLHLVHFAKVKGHSGDKWNDYVDRLAREAIHSSGR